MASSITSSWVIYHPSISSHLKNHQIKRSFSLSSWSHIKPNIFASSSTNNMFPRKNLSGKRRNIMMGNSSIYSLETSLLHHKVNAQKEDYPVDQTTVEEEVFAWSSVILP